jgi:ubiquinone/menaquinone biosynthesis C-methylase UbiE
VIRESGMPDQEMWASFFSPADILKKMGLNSHCHKVVDFGCGYGTFSIPAAQITKGIVYAFDIDDGFITECEHRAKQAGLRTVICEKRDFILNGVGLADNMVAYAMLFNILHARDPVKILQEAYRVLTPLGKVGVIHWNYDATTPRGPSMKIRPRPGQCQAWIKLAGFELVEPLIELPPYHYGMVGQKPKNDFRNNQENKKNENTVHNQ